MKRTVRFLYWSLGVAVLACLLAVIGFLGLYLPYKNPTLTEAPLASGGNALWVEHKFVGEKLPPGEYRLLVENAKRHHIDNLYMHAGPFDRSGHVPVDRFAHAQHGLNALRTIDPNLRLFAWLGQVEKAGGGPLDLGNATVRTGIVAATRLFLDLGFDGVHLNIEPIRDGDKRFLELLDGMGDATRERSKQLSVAAYKPSFAPGMDWWSGRKNGRGAWWSARYYGEVGKRVDQMAVMLYDTALKREWWYTVYAAFAARRLPTWIPQGTRIFFGVPTYAERRRPNLPPGESLGAALSGARLGLADVSASDRSRVGAAIFANWTTSTDDWRVFARLWLGESPSEESGPIYGE